MLDLFPLLKKEEIEVERKEIEVILEDDSLRPLTLSFPPVVELEQIRGLYHSKISVHEIANEIDLCDPRTLRNELDKFYAQYEQYKNSPTFMSQLANLHLLLRENDKAEAIFEDANRRFGNDFLKHKFGDELLRSQRFGEAKALYDIIQGPADTYTLLRKAFFAIYAHNTVEAEQFIKLAMDIDPLDYNTLILKGGVELFSGNYQRAIRSFRLAVQEKPNSSTAFVNLATAYWCTRHVNQALKALRTAIEINPLNQNAIIFYSDLTFIIGDASKAIRCLSAFTNYNQKSDIVWARLARAHYFNGEYSKAREALRHQASIKETSSVWNNLGLVYCKLNEKERGLKYISLAIGKAENNPNSLEAPLMNLISVLFETNDHRKALKLSKNLIASHDLPESIQEKLYLKYIIALDSLKKHDAATAEAERLLSGGIKDIEIKLWLLLHLIYYKTVLEDNMASAHMFVQRALSELQARPKISPILWTRVHNACMFSFLCFDKIDEAKKLIPALQSSFHNDPFSTATLGLYNLKKERPEKAIELYKEAISICSDRDFKLKIKQRMNLELGKYYENTDMDKAMAYLEKAKRITDGYDYVRQDILSLQAKIRLTTYKPKQLQTKVF